VSLLGAEQVGDPDRGPSIPEDPFGHLLPPAGLDDMEDGIGAEEDPFPPVPSLWSAPLKWSSLNVSA
jgi:hypothetical protein